MDVRMFVNSNVRNAYIWVLVAILKRHTRQTNLNHNRTTANAEIFRNIKF
jgi:hypothetical protein